MSLTSEETRHLGEITIALRRSADGQQGAWDEVMDLVYRDLRQIASRQRRNMPGAMTLDATGLVHEAFLRLVEYTNASWDDRGHFYAVAARAMRQIVVDYCRNRLAQKRGGGHIRESLDEEMIAATQKAEDILSVEEAMGDLREVDPKLAKVVECRFFAGLTEPETAEAMGISLRSAQRYWGRAREALKAKLT